MKEVALVVQVIRAYTGGSPAYPMIARPHNSGNVVCTAPTAPDAFAASVAAALTQQVGLAVDVVARSAAEIDEVLARDRAPATASSA